MDHLAYASLLRLHQIADIDGEQEIGGAVAPFRRHALDQALLGEDHIDLDARLLGEFVEERIDEIGLAVGVDVHLGRLASLGGMAKGTDKNGGEKREQYAPREGNLHAHLSNGPGVKHPVSDCGLYDSKRHISA